MDMHKYSNIRQKNQLLWLILIGVFLFPVSAMAQLPNDPNVHQWSYELLNVAHAWDYTQGSQDVVVAIIDNGFDTFHPDLFANVWQNKNEIAGNGLDDDNNGYIDDVYGWDFHDPLRDEPGYADGTFSLGDNDPRPDVLSLAAKGIEVRRHFHHGTVVAGIIGAVGNNSFDGAGINWHVRLMNLKVTDDNTGQGRISALAEAILYAVNNGADIINFSVVGSDDERMRQAIAYAYDHGVAMVAASGNSMFNLNSNPFYPVCADAGGDKEMILGVSAIREGRFASGFSNVGSDCIDLAAPGVGISSTMRYAPSYGLTDAYGGDWQGTSFGAPFVSGAMALLKSIHSGWNPDVLYDIILSTVSRTPPEDPEQYATFFGAGLIDIGAAVDEALARKALLGPSIASIALQHDEAAFELLDDGTLSSITPVRSFETANETTANLPSIIDRVRIARVGNVIGDSALETILIGSSGAQELLVILSEDGTILHAVIIGKGDFGLAVVDTDANGIDEIFTYPKQGGGVVRKWLDGRTVDSWILPIAKAWQFLASYEDGKHVVY